MDSRRARVLVAISVLLLVLSSGCGTPQTPPPEQPQAEAANRCPLDGTVLYRDGEAAERTLAVIIDNDPAAQPLSGLSRACLVYELPVEGGLTRFLALYCHQDAALAGPVRSARSYFLPLVQENDAILAHVGGSAAALAGIKAAGLDEFDELTTGAPFWLGTNRQRPYATFTNTDQLRTAALKAGLRSTGNEAPVAAFSEAGSFSATQAADPAGALEDAATIAVGGGATVEYRYDSTDATYHRFTGGNEQRDLANGGSVSPTTVVILFLAGKANPAGPEGSVRFLGQGNAFFFSGGVGVAGSWRKTSAAARTEWLDPAGKPIVLKPGQIWVHYVYSDTAITPDLADK